MNRESVDTNGMKSHGIRHPLEPFHFEWTRSSIMSLTAADRMVRACAGAPDNRRAALRP